MPLSSSIRTPRRAVSTALTSAFCLLSLAALPAGASAADESVVATTPSGINILETADTAQTCQAPQTLNAFSSFGDMRDYVLAPGGDFEGKALDGWQVTKARQDGDHSPLRVDRDANEHSLKVPAGGTAVSPAMCVDLHYPTMRFMAKSEQQKGRLEVEVVYPDSDNPVFHDAAELDANGKAWNATADVPVYPERGGVAPGMRRVALRFKSVAGGTEAGEWRIDDIYVDPHRR
jgi:hypothetical protein